MSSYFGEMPDYLKNISLGDCMYKAYKFCCEKFGDTFADSDSGRLFVHNVGVKDYQFLLKLKKEQEEMEKSKPIEGFDIAYSDEELQTAQELFEGAKRLNKAINDAMHDKLINSNKEQEKMKKYEINLQEVAEDLNGYLDGTGTSWDYDVYAKVSKMQNCIFVKNVETQNDVVILKWHTDEGLDWENRWGVQTVESQYYSSQGEMTLYKLSELLDDLDDFLNHWYDDNEEPEPDMKRDLPQVIKNALLEVYNSDALKIHVTITTNSLGDNFINLAIKSTYTYSTPSHEEYEPREQLIAKYLIKDRSAFVVDMRTFNEFLTKSEEINTIVRKCVMEWDK